MKRKLYILVTLILGSALLFACFPSPPATSSGIEETQALLFAQATLTKMAADEQISQMQTEQAAPVETESPTAVPPTATEVPPTPTEVPPTPTNTSVPPTAAIIFPTAVIVYPTAVLSVPEVRINFATGTTNANVVGSVAAYKSQRYVFWAAKDQLIDVSLSSGQDAAISISSRAGTVLLSSMGSAKSYRGYLPASGDWFIDIRAGASNANFELYLMIPQRLSFATGTYGLTTTGSVPAGRVHNFIAWAAAGQTLKMSVAPVGSLALSIYGVDGTVLLSSMGESTSYEGVLPSSQDYIINVRSMPGVGSYAFTFTIDIH